MLLLYATSLIYVSLQTLDASHTVNLAYHGGHYHGSIVRALNVEVCKMHKCEQGQSTLTRPDAHV